MIDNPSIGVPTFTRHILTLLSVDEKLLPRYVNMSTNFKSLPHRVEKAPPRLKRMYSVLFAFTWRLMPPVVAPDYAAGIRLGEELLQEVLDHLRCLCLI